MGNPITYPDGADEATKTLIDQLNVANMQVTRNVVPPTPFAGSTPYVKVSDVKTSGTAGGEFTAGSYLTRVLNTKDTDTASIATLANNQLTLPAGTYRCLIKCPVFAVNFHKAVLYNVTDSATTLIGTTEFAAVDSVINIPASSSIISGQFTIAAQKTFEVRHRCSLTHLVNGFGLPASFGDSEVYTVAEFWKVT